MKEMNKQRMNYELIKFNYLGIIILLAVVCQVLSSNCSVPNSLTAAQNIKYSKFASASYIYQSDEDALISAYTSLTRKLGNYLIEIESYFSIDVNDIQSCKILPDYVTFNNLDDVWICMKEQVMILQCNKQWELKIGCGSFLQIHKPFHTQVLGKLYLSQDLIKNSFSIPLVNLCSGTYHIWFIYSTRIGKVIKSVKPIFVSYPSCECYG